MFLVYLMLLAGPELYRPPVLKTLPQTKGRPVWVFFTDKGFTTQTQYQTALRRVALVTGSLSCDFYDLPVHVPYLEAVERLGGRLRFVSQWLNAASFDIPEACLPEIAELPFVHNMLPVAERTYSETPAPVPVSARHRVKSQALDTAMTRRFYGAAYDQAAMMGIPELFFQGYYGSGVRLAIFDTGLKLKNTGILGLRIADQYDFLSQDNFYTASSPTFQPQPADRLRFMGLVKDPCLITTTSPAGTALLTFVADSFSYSYNAPRRAIFVSRSNDAGRTWSSAVPLVLSQPASQISSHTFENLRMIQKDSVTYLAYNELLSRYRARPEASAYIGYFVNGTWQGASRVGSGRWPDLVIVADTMFFCCVESDSSLLFRKATLTTLPPRWTVSRSLRTTATCEDLKLTADSTGVVNVFALDQHTGQVSLSRSTDGGATFTPPRVIADQASALCVTFHQGELLLFLRNMINPPLSRIFVLASTDRGETWTPRTPAADSLLTLGRFSVASHQTELTVLYESAGLLYMVSSTDAGSNWSLPQILDSTGFSCQPVLATAPPLLAAWVKRGDTNAVWEEVDSYRFSPDQPDHGTRMASIICGFQPYSLVGVAPGVDLLVAKTEFHKTAGGRYYEYNMEEDTYIAALEWAASRRADIVSTSLGYRGWYADNQFDGKTAPISLAAGIAAQKGMIVVTAMGNRDTTNYPWPLPYLTAPADAYGVIAVGGVQRNLLPWRGTGTGPTSDGRTKPELVALSDTVAVVAPDSLYGLEGSVGTSCATALVAGACALIKEAHPNWNAESLKAVLFASAGRTVPSCTFGYGVPRIDWVFKHFPPEPGVKGIPRDEILPFPNPFTAGGNNTPTASGLSNRIYFALYLARPTPDAQISIYSISGTLVDTIPLLTAPISRPGRYQNLELLEQVGAYWDGRNAAGRPVASGLYLAVLRTTHGTASAKFCVLR